MPSSGDPVLAQSKRAIWLGTGLLGVVLLLVAVLAGILLGIRHATPDNQPLLAVGVLASFVVLVVALAGLVLIFNALGLSDPDSALGLPSGSIRALLALSLVSVFVGVCSAELFGTAQNNDSAKQILGIAATALTTIIGFYFGSNAANEAFNAANQAANPDTSTSDTSGAPPTLDQLTQQAASIKAIADALQQQLAAANNPSPDQIAHENPDTAALAALRDKLSTITAQVTAAGVDRDRATKLVADTTGDTSKLAGSAAAMQQYSADAANAQAAFAAGLTAYTAARDAILATLAKG